MDLSPDTLAPLFAQLAAAVAATLAMRRRPVQSEPLALPAPAPVPAPVACACDEAMIARAVQSAIDPERIKMLVRQALHSEIERAGRTHESMSNAVDLLLANAQSIALLSERCAHITATVEAIRSQREQITPPLGFTR